MKYVEGKWTYALGSYLVQVNPPRNLDEKTSLVMNTPAKKISRLNYLKLPLSFYFSSCLDVNTHSWFLYLN